MSIRISINRLRLIGLVLFFIQAACMQEKPTGSFTTTPSNVSLRKNESPLSMGESSLSEDEIMKMIEAIKLPGYMEQSKKYLLRAEMASNNLPIIKEWFKQIFKGEESIHTRKVLQGRKRPMTVSPLSAVLLYDVDIRLIQALVSQEANVNEKEDVNDKLKISPLRFAFLYASPHVIEWLLNEEADLETGHCNKYPASFLLLDFLNENPNRNYETAALLVEKLQNKLGELGEKQNNVVHRLVSSYEKPTTPKNKKEISDILTQLFQQYPDAFRPCFEQKNKKKKAPLDLVRISNIPQQMQKAIQAMDVTLPVPENPVDNDQEKEVPPQVSPGTGNTQTKKSVSFKSIKRRLTRKKEDDNSGAEKEKNVSSSNKGLPNNTPPEIERKDISSNVGRKSSNNQASKRKKGLKEKVKSIFSRKKGITINVISQPRKYNFISPTDGGIAVPTKRTLWRITGNEYDE